MRDLHNDAIDLIIEVTKLFNAILSYEGDEEVKFNTEISMQMQKLILDKMNSIYGEGYNSCYRDMQ